MDTKIKKKKYTEIKKKYVKNYEDKTNEIN